jgi:hypothetical protein
MGFRLRVQKAVKDVKLGILASLARRGQLRLDEVVQKCLRMYVLLLLEASTSTALLSSFPFIKETRSI